MSPFPDDKDDFDDEENKDVVSQHARMLSVEIANRIHPSLDFFEEHLEEVKEYALVTIAQLEEVKLFLKRQNVKREKSITSTKREDSVFFSEKKKKKKSKEQEHEQQQQESFGVSDDENENENENDVTSDDDENVLQSRDTRRNQMEIDLSKLTARLEQDFAFIDSARETLNVIERKVSEMEEDVWEKEKATVKTRVDQRVEQVKDQFGRMLSSMFSSSKE